MNVPPTSPELSVVVPLFNEEEGVLELLKELKNACEALSLAYEIILVDDGSSDKTYVFALQAAQHDHHIKVVKLSRNFGHQAAFNAGIDFASGQMIITMDGDLQHPPAMIPEFVKQARVGADIVLGQRMVNRQNSSLRGFAGNLFYWFLRKASSLDLAANVSDFTLYGRRVVDTLKRMPERDRFLRGLAQWVGFKKVYVPYTADVRKFGTPKYSFRKLATLGLSGITSFSAFPLRLAFWVGSVVFLASICFGGYVAWDHYVNPNPLIAGWATVVILVLALGSIQLMVLGIIGEYLYRMFNELKGRPLYIVSATHNIDAMHTPHTPYGIS